MLTAAALSLIVIIATPLGLSLPPFLVIVLLIVFILRIVLINGTPLPLVFHSRSYYIRRYVSPQGAVAGHLTSSFRQLIADSLPSPLPHSYLALSDVSGARVLHEKHAHVLCVYESETNKLVMFHVMFRADYVAELVMHLGLVVVHPEHRGRGLQALAAVNCVMACVTMCTSGFVMTDVGASAGGCRRVAEGTSDCFPNYRHAGHIVSDRARVEGDEREDVRMGEVLEAPRWQRRVFDFMMREHRRDFGTSEAAKPDASRFLVRGSNIAKGGGSAALVTARPTSLAPSTSSTHGGERAGADVGALRFLEMELESRDDEMFHVCRTSVADLVFRTLMLRSSILRVVIGVCLFVVRIPWVLAGVLLDRVDILLNTFAGWLHANAVVLVVYKEDACGRVTQGILRRGERRIVDIDLVDRSCRIGDRYPLWIANHYNWFDHGVLSLLSVKKLPVVYKSDLANENLAARILIAVHDVLGSITYIRGDRKSGARVREGIRDALLTGPMLVFPEGTSQDSGVPLRFHTGAMETAYENGSPVQPIALYYSEECGAGPSTSALIATSELLRHATQCVVYFAPPVLPEEFSSASAFASRCEEEVQRAYARIRRGYSVT